MGQRLQGDIISYKKDRYFGYIKRDGSRSNFEDLLFRLDNVQRDSTLSRAWCMVEVGTIPITYLEGEHNGRIVAVDVAPMFGFEPFEGDLRAHREVSTVERVTHNSFGFARRECGDTIFFHRNDVVPEFSERWKYLQPGVPFYHGIQGEDGSHPRATCIELYGPNELVDPEPEVVTEPTIEILQPENRSKTLYELIQERRNERAS